MKEFALFLRYLEGTNFQHDDRIGIVSVSSVDKWLQSRRAILEPLLDEEESPFSETDLF